MQQLVTIQTILEVLLQYTNFLTTMCLFQSVHSVEPKTHFTVRFIYLEFLLIVYIFNQNFYYFCQMECMAIIESIVVCYARLSGEQKNINI